jgi:hypothetical protein
MSLPFDDYRQSGHESLLPVPLTHELVWHRLFYGTLKPVMRGGRHV